MTAEYHVPLSQSAFVITGLAILFESFMLGIIVVSLGSSLSLK